MLLKPSQMSGNIVFSKGMSLNLQSACCKELGKGTEHERATVDFLQFYVLFGKCIPLAGWLKSPQFGEFWIGYWIMACKRSAAVLIIFVQDRLKCH